MPTALPAPRSEDRSLPCLEIARFYVLIARSRWLHRRLKAADRRVQRLRLDRAGLELPAVARRWLGCQEETAALLGQPVPPQVWAVLRSAGA